MFERFIRHRRKPGTTLFLVVAVSVALVWTASISFRPAAPVAVPTTGAPSAAPPAPTEGDAPRRKLEGDEARAYLERTGEGRSLMRALEVERFGLKWEGRAPFADASEGGGYLGMSHDENLSVWFDEAGATLRPTLSEQERDKAWRFGMRLRAYGYGARLHEARASVSGTAKESRIEYERAAGGDGSGGRVVEWYVNKTEGIEQGFTLDARPARGADVGADEPLRLVVAVTGDLRARAAADGQAVELDRGGEGVLSYSKLTAFDARGERLAARMETNEAGDEIALVVEDAAAQYPIVVDPITATLRAEIGAGLGIQQDARFGFAVAIAGNLAVVGAWREDIPGLPEDQGAIYIFVRDDTWVLEKRQTVVIDGASSPQCGWSVAVHRNGMVIGCPGFSNSKGFAFFQRRNGPNSYNGFAATFTTQENGDRYGDSVAVGEGRNSGWDIIVGAPLNDIPGKTDVGAVSFLQYDSSFALISGQQTGGATATDNAHFGSSVAVDNGRAVVGKAVGDVDVFERPPAGGFRLITNLVGDNQATPTGFGDRVAISGDTVVVSAPLFDTTTGTDAGAVYVYDLRQVDPQVDPDFNVLTGQRLTGSDSKPGDFFGSHAVAVEGNIIVVGAFGNGQGGDPLNGIPDDDRGAVYVFTRSNGVWSQQTKISQNNFQGGEAGDHFGIDVDISGATLIIGARAASAGSTSRAGAAFIYELNCLPPSHSQVTFLASGGATSLTACPGDSRTLLISSSFTAPVNFQWRRNGVNIPGANAASYTINNISASDAGSYDIIITNACGSEISTPATLDVHTLNINPTSQNFSASGSNGIVNVTSTGNCGWTATSNASWITVTSGASGTGNGTVGFSVAANTGAQRTGTLSVARQTFTVTQDGTAPPASTFQFGQSSYSAGEGAGSLLVTVTRAGNTASAANVDYATTDGTANERGDYTTALGTLRFAAGETAKTFKVFITDDVHVETNETLNLTLSNPSGGAALGSPASATVTINENDAAATSVNPIDSTTFFVRQHYVDFLNREPDAGGLAFWTQGIDSCGADQQCREVKRVDTSAAFFLSIEFQETGFLVHRAYRAAFNRFPRYREFLRDTQEMGRDVIVGQGAWAARLEANKQQFTSDFAARAEFLAIYGGMANEQYVDALNVNTGGSLSASERNTLVAGLNGGTETRAAVLRKVAEDSDFAARELRPAFVLAEYVGYLRRNPDDAPDTNFDGYNFWLAKLNEFGGDFRRAEMVRAFISSIEYRQRFGQ